MAEPEAHTFVTDPYVEGVRLIPPPSIELLLRFRFPYTTSTTPAREEEDKARIERIYTWLKDLALSGAPEMGDIIQQIFTVSFGLLGQGYDRGLAEEASSIAIWSLTENDDCWKHWYSICEEKENLESSVALLKNLVKKWNETIHSTDIHSFFEIRYCREATEIAIWSLTENVVCWEHWDNLYTENIEASAALLEALVDKLNDPSLKLLSSPTDTLTLTQTIKSFRLKNKNAIIKRRYNYYEEADEYCKVISGRLSSGSIRLKGTCIIAVILVTVVATLLHLFYLRVFGF